MAQVHIGKKIKEVVGKSNFSVTEFAKNINRSRDVAYKIFAKENMDTGLLQQICKVLEHDFFNYYSQELPFNHPNTEEDGLRMVAEPQAAYTTKHDLRNVSDELKACKKQLSDFEKKYELLEKVNRLTEEKLEGMKSKKK